MKSIFFHSTSICGVLIYVPDSDQGSWLKECNEQKIPAHVRIFSGERIGEKQYRCYVMAKREKEKKTDKPGGEDIKCEWGRKRGICLQNQEVPKGSLLLKDPIPKTKGYKLFRKEPVINMFCFMGSYSLCCIYSALML